MYGLQGVGAFRRTEDEISPVGELLLLLLQHPAVGTEPQAESLLLLHETVPKDDTGSPRTPLGQDVTVEVEQNPGAVTYVMK